jgi:hypothetical protein
VHDDHDQMHIVHDFTRLSGDSPEAIARQLDMFVQPEVLSGRPTPLTPSTAKRMRVAS